MSKLYELKELKRKIECGECTISDLKKVYDSVNTEQEVIIANKGDITHIYYRNIKTRTVTLEKKLLPYSKSLYSTVCHPNYPIDLCYLRFYDEDINRYGQGIIIPRINNFVMVDNMDLIEEPRVTSFCTKGIKENNKQCVSIVDKSANVYRIDGYHKNNKDFNIEEIRTLNRSIQSRLYGILVYYKDRPVFVDIVEPPYIIMDKDTLQKCAQRQPNLSYYIENFDDGFMEGKRYVKK